MVCEYGMSDRLGMVRLGRRHGNPFLGRDLMEDRDYSEEIAKAIDEEVRAFIDQGYERARNILTENRAKMDEIAEILLEKEIADPRGVPRAAGRHGQRRRHSPQRPDAAHRSAHNRHDGCHPGTGAPAHPDAGPAPRTGVS